MTAPRPNLVSLLTLASACVVPGRPPKTEQAAVSEPMINLIERPVRVDESGPLAIEMDGRMLAPTDISPSREVGMTDEPIKLGWSRVTGEFVVCLPSGGAVCERCDFHRVGRQRERLGVGEDCGPERVAPRDLDARLRLGDFRIENGSWLYGAEVVLVIAHREGPPDAYGTPRGVVEIGARLRTEGAAIGWIDRIERCDPDWCAPDVHVDAVAPSPDGQTLAVLAHTFAGEFTDTYPLLLLDAQTVAAAAYEAAGPTTSN